MNSQQPIQRKVIDHIPVELDLEEFLRVLRVRRLKKKDVDLLLRRCHQLIEPKAVYAFVNVSRIEMDKVKLSSGDSLRSIILAEMLEEGQKIALYVVTIGCRLENVIPRESEGSILKAWTIEKIGDYALGKASAHIRSHVEEVLGGAVSSFSPGSGTGKLFDIKQQKTIFKVLDPPRTVGVDLTRSHLMVPRKSVSGVFAATRWEYIACQFCPRERCESRRRPFSGEYYPLNCGQKASL